MTDVLARIRVEETHGIRRFLYPLTAFLVLPHDVELSTLSLTLKNGEAVPLQVTRQPQGRVRVDFAVSLAPLQPPTDLWLKVGGPRAAIPDPLQITEQEDGTLRSSQERFQIELSPGGQVRGIVYDGVSHLREASGICRRANGADPLEFEVGETTTGGGELAAWSRTTSVYEDGCRATMTAEITACKSWVMLTYRLEQPRAGETVVFTLPLEEEISSARTPRTIFDTGVDGLYGRADSEGAFLNWFAPSAPGEGVRWEVGKQQIQPDGRRAARVDYVGTTEGTEGFQRQRWLHLVQGAQAVAVAVTKIPARWKSLKVQMGGTVGLELTLPEGPAERCEIGVCYHFLNDVPAIAAATNPQSILLPPSVEVLPV